jgi:[NiFe] hydrogenase diaphorase moiety large subunit
LIPGSEVYDMGDSLDEIIKEICKSCGYDRTRMMDIVRQVQQRVGYVSSEAMDLIAAEVGAHRVQVESVVSFYAFFSDRPKGKVVIRLCNDVIDLMKGARRVARAFTEELGIGFGETTPDGKISLEYTPCIGMCDQAPAALVNDEVVTYLSSDSARRIVVQLKKHLDPTKLIHSFGDGNNAHDLVHSSVYNNIRQSGEVIFCDRKDEDGLQKSLNMTPAEVIRDIKTARLRGRGGAGFPTGMKWEFTRAAEGERRFVICNADEGEPGTFKDRVILTEKPDLLFEGMTIAGYAIGADTGIVYLRAEYAYLRKFLEHVLAQRREKGLLGKNVCGRDGFNFDIRIQMGAGAYICGEETSLISSCEGARGDPKNRPPFPAQKGYLGCPTTVNNVETFCCVARILEMGPGWFTSVGSKGSPGTKLLSISGDCTRPGVFEVPFGITLREMLKKCSGTDAIAVQVGGPSGQMVGPDQFDRTICYDDLATGGSIMVFGPTRNLLKKVRHFLEFFVEESCGYCTPCRVGNVLLLERVNKLVDGRGEPSDLPYLEELCETVKMGSRCGLGQTSVNPVISTLKNFRAVYESAVKPRDDGLQPSFDVRAALADAEQIAERCSVHFTEKV